MKEGKVVVFVSSMMFFPVYTLRVISWVVVGGLYIASDCFLRHMRCVFWWFRFFSSCKYDHSGQYGCKRNLGSTCKSLCLIYFPYVIVVRLVSSSKGGLFLMCS